MRIRSVLVAASVVVAGSVNAWAQDPAPADEQAPGYEEQVVVTASRSEETLVNAPAAVSVITASKIQHSPAANMGDLLRSVPGVNVTQVSARDINITARGATSTLATSQLALVDGRSIYLDFFGMVMWDLVPSNVNEIRQIEVIRGPASAVWGANAMTGVVNVITKTPRELAAQGKGTAMTMTFGGFDRTVGSSNPGAGSLFSINGSHARAVNDRVAFKVSAGYLTQDPLARPTGTIPNSFRTPYPPFANTGTQQPKVDARLDYDLANGGGTVSVSGGYAGTEGIIHSGIGPFDIRQGSGLTYFSGRYTKGARRVAFFTNLLHGDAANLLTVSPNGQRLGLLFDTKTFDIEAGDTTVVGKRHVFTYGGNYRRNTFDISIAPDGRDRNEGGAYVQDEVFLSEMFRWVIGGRVDKFSSIQNAVFSPRTTLLFKPERNQTVRVSVNRAFRAPSFVNNNISTALINQLNLGSINPLLAGQVYNFPITATGNTNLKQETMTAIELGYTGVVRNRATLTAAVYWNTTDNAIFFSQATRYTAAAPPPRWPLPPVVLELLAAQTGGAGLPSSFTYKNLGTVKDKGIELGIDASLNRYVNVFTNYSYQWQPIAEGFALSEINIAPRNRFNAGFDFGYKRWLGNMNVSYTGDAFWQDVLDSRYSGTTDPYTTVNGTVGVKWFDNRVTTSLKVNNLGNRTVLQHIFGDVMRRQIVGEVRVGF